METLLGRASTYFLLQYLFQTSPEAYYLPHQALPSCQILISLVGISYENPKVASIEQTLTGMAP